MDLSVSPDIEAYFCYAIVFLLGAVTAVVQINRGLGDLAGIWLIPGTWLLFLMYLSVPVGLFWFLDRTGAITDTSLFAAALIGIGYERIMNGTTQAFASSAGLLQFWTPFKSYADEVQKSVMERTQLNESRLIEGLVSSVLTKNSRYARLESMALHSSANATELRAKLAAIDAEAAATAPPAAVTGAAAATATGAAVAAATATAAHLRDLLENKTRLLFTELAKVPDRFYLMRNYNIISWKVYWLDVKGGRRFLCTLLVFALVTAALGAVLWWAHPNLKNLSSSYYIWRLVKTNATSVEQNRARSNLLALMNVQESPVREVVTRSMTEVLRQPSLPVERVDMILQSLLESRNTNDTELPKQLVASLHSSSVDARTRINDVLKHLAETSCVQKFSETKEKDKAKAWKPSDGDATVSLEMRIETWKDYWNNICNKKSAELVKKPDPAKPKQKRKGGRRKP